MGVKGELSLASPNPHRGFGWREIAWAGFFGRVGEEDWGCEGAAGTAPGRAEVRGRGEGVGWGRCERKRPVCDQSLRKMGTKRGWHRGVPGERVGGGGGGAWRVRGRDVG